MKKKSVSKEKRMEVDISKNGTSHSLRWRTTTQQLIIAGAVGIAALHLIAKHLHDQRLEEQIKSMERYMGSSQFQTKIIDVDSKKSLEER